MAPVKFFDFRWSRKHVPQKPLLSDVDLQPLIGFIFCAEKEPSMLQAVTIKKMIRSILGVLLNTDLMKQAPLEPDINIMHCHYGQFLMEVGNQEQAIYDSVEITL